MKCGTVVQKTTTLTFTWTEEEIADLLRREAAEHVAKLTKEGDRTTMEYAVGSRYEGGIEARVGVTIYHGEAE